MSIDINWDILTTGPDGKQLSESIRDFIHDKFQEIPFPRFIQSVNVVSFDLGTIAPDIEIKDICEPYPEFYEDAYADGDDDEDDDEEEDEEQEKRRRERERRRRERRERQHRAEGQNDGVNDYDDGSHHGHNAYDTPGGIGVHASSAPLSPPAYFENRYPGFRPTAFSSAVDQLTSPPQLRRTGTNLHYFHSSLSSGFSGALTPLAPFQQASQANVPRSFPLHHNDEYSPSQSPPSSTGDSSSPIPPAPPSLARMQSTDSSGVLEDGTREPPPTPFQPDSVIVGGVTTSSSNEHGDTIVSSGDDRLVGSLASLRSTDAEGAMLPPPRLQLREPRDTDAQIVARVKYAGNIRMEMTMELLLDYPAPSFVSLPVRVTVTGLTFDGTAVVAYIRRRAHFCFVDDGDDGGAGTAATSEERGGGAASGMGGAGSGSWTSGSRGVGKMLKEIKIESEIGEKGRGKQVLKNVGKVERFVLERVRRILEDEFIFPSSWTFLI